MGSLTELRWYAVDFDGTIATKNEDYSIGEPIEDNIKKLQEVIDAGYKIVIHTARHWEEYQDIEQWLKKYKIPYKGIVCGKILAHRYVDDRGINADERSWL